mgnify:CR=1 FL=1|jgi:hypothetical protein
MNLGNKYCGIIRFYDEKSDITTTQLCLYPLMIGWTLMHDEDMYIIDLVLFNKIKFGLSVMIL